MKSTIFLAFFLLFAFSTTLPSTTADDVYDTDGQKVMLGGSYHMIPALEGRGGGIELAKTGNETCPFTIVQASSDDNPGLPLQFLIEATHSFPISVGGSYRVDFSERLNFFPNLPSWFVVEEFPIGWSVKIGYKEGRPFDQFRIEKYEKLGEGVYKLVYCPDNSNVCGDLGIKHRRLIVRDEHPFAFRLKKAATAGSSAESWNIINA